MNLPSVTVVAVTWRSRQKIDRCLSALRPAHDEGWLSAIVVDNASGDGTAELVRAEHPWVALIESGGNLGFGRGNNLGLGAVTTPYILFLNPDARISKQALVTLVKFLEGNPQAGIVGPAIDNGGGKPQPLLPFLTPGLMLRRAIGRPRPTDKERTVVPGSAPERVDWVCGAVFLMRTDLAKRLGGFDPRFFLYFEEMDLCKRAIAAGFEVWAIGEAQTEHEFASSSRQSGMKLYDGCIAKDYFESRFYYLSKHHGLPKAITAELFDFGSACFRALKGFVIGKPHEQSRVRIGFPVPRMPRSVSPKT